MAASKDLLVHFLFCIFPVGDVPHTFPSKLEHFVNFYFIFSKSACFVKTHCLEMGSFDGLLGLSPKYVFPFKPDQTKGIDNVEVNWAGWRKGINCNKENV